MYCRNCGSEVAENAEICTKCGVRPLNSNKFCQNCGSEVTAQQEVCTKCGVRLLGGIAGFQGTGGKMISPSQPPKNPAVATILSCLIAGVGQMYLGQVLKGLVILLGGVVLAIITGGLAGIPIWIAAMVDAYMIGKKLESGQSVGEWEFF